MRLCLNCLEMGDVRDVPVGRPKGSQRDPIQLTLALCVTCTQALERGEFGLLAARYAEERTVRRPD